MASPSKVRLPSLSIPVAPLISQAKSLLQKPPGRRSFSSRPNCTHMRMVKVYGGGWTCDLCHKEPCIGFIYVCDQDSQSSRGPGRSPSAAQPTPKAKAKAIPHMSAYDELRQLGASKSLLRDVANGHYSDAQLETLKQQRRHLNQTLAAALSEQEEAAARMLPQFPALAEHIAHQHQRQRQRQRQHSSPSIQPPPRKSSLHRALNYCKFKVCHACRPASRDRTFASIDDVLNGKEVIPTKWDRYTMPTQPANVVRNLGLRPPASPSPFAALRNADWGDSDDDYDSDFDDDESSEALYTEDEDGDGTSVPGFSRAFRSAFARSGSASASMHTIVEANSEDDADDNAGFRHSLERSYFELVRSDQANHEASGYTPAFDLQDWKVRVAAQQALAASVPLPPDSSDDLRAQYRLQAVEIDDQGRVPGGVALTEEAVEYNEPDVITSV